MFTFIAFLLTLAGCANWLMVGLLQYDFIAGIFGWQGSIMSRLVYILFGFGAAYLLLRVIINKGSVKVWEKKKKKQKEEQAQQSQALPEKKKGFFARLFKKKKKQDFSDGSTQVQPAFADIEAAKEMPQKADEENFETEKSFFQQKEENPQTLFDEHIKKD